MQAPQPGPTERSGHSRHPGANRSWAWPSGLSRCAGSLRYPQDATELRDRPGEPAIDADGSNRSIGRVRPATEGRRAAIQIVGRGCGVDSRAVDGLQRLVAFKACGTLLGVTPLLVSLHVCAPNPAAQAGHGTKFFRGIICPTNKGTGLEAAPELGFAGQSLPQSYPPRLPWLTEVESCFPMLLVIPFSACLLMVAAARGLPSGPTTPFFRNARAISSARSTWLGYKSLVLSRRMMLRASARACAIQSGCLSAPSADVPDSSPGVSIAGPCPSSTATPYKPAYFTKSSWAMRKY